MMMPEPCTDAAALRVFERQVLRKIYGVVRVDDDFRIRFNSELCKLLNNIDVMQRINIQSLRWLGYVVSMEEDAPAKPVFDVGICRSQQNQRRLEVCIATGRNPLIGLL